MIILLNLSITFLFMNQISLVVTTATTSEEDPTATSEIPATTTEITTPATEEPTTIEGL